MSFDKIYQHMMKGVVFHTQLSEYYGFLNLTKYSDFHAHQAKEEFATLIRFQTWHMNHYGKLIPQTTPTVESIIPKDWYSHVRTDVDKATVRQGVQNGHTLWADWQKQTKKLYEDSIKQAETEVDKIEIRKLLEEVCEELAFAKRKHLSLKNCDYDICQIIQENEEVIVKE